MNVWGVALIDITAFNIPPHNTHTSGQLTILDYLINELGVDPVAREKSGVSTVHAAVQAGQYKAVKVTQYTILEENMFSKELN